ncbi:NAD+ synthase [Bosea lathyri]|uniref:Glutamine-dependent NAD(+) synthetase n=1 Tax=Bosea lathyri TaxID=1036778 RepID=A0A1H6BYS5_9HYPH|nr:NAD+ synthase [Bosea lathyri]SEG65286.1 NH(3)-dependent NAD(+) synthetase [Bosea lathyri]
MTTPSLRLALAQLNPIVGDIAGNTGKARAARQRAGEAGADLVMLPELFLCGYPPEDLVLKPAFQDACRKACEELARETGDGGPALLIGLPWAENGKLYNAYALLDGGVIQSVRFKVVLPDYGVFDEARIFEPGPLPGPVVFRNGIRLGLPICEDIWSEDVVECLAETGAELLLSPNGSPYRRGVGDERMNIAVARVVESGLPLVYLNQIGGQDELVFDGASFILGADRRLMHQLPAFQEALVVTDWAREAGQWRCKPANAAEIETGDEADYAACVLALRDYVGKTGFPGVVLGLSGGIDSALCAAMAVDALGAERVTCVMMPSRFTAQQSLSDAQACAQALGVRYETVSIAGPVEGFEAALAGLFAGTKRDVTEENLQSRARGTLLMALSNKFSWMLVTTGNKSEMSCGYATLYGDMNGGFNAIKDLYKTDVMRLAQLRNRWRPTGSLGPDGVVIPESTIARPPSAELSEDQTDQDTLPPYDVLDDILAGLIERDERVAAIVARGHDLDTVMQVERLLQRAEYKRRQSAPGAKITTRNLSRDRRYPIVNGFSDRGEGPHSPDASLVKGVGKAGGDSFDF